MSPAGGRCRTSGGAAAWSGQCVTSSGAYLTGSAQQESKLPYPSIVALNDDDAGVPKVDAFLPYGGIRIEDNVCVGRMGRRI